MKLISFSQIICFILFFCSVQAQLSTSQIFNNNAVLQRGETIPVWGWGTPNTQLKLTFNNKTYSTKISIDGKWEVKLDPHKAGGPYSILINSEDELIKYEGIYFGDVWLCSGQSNMEWVLRNTQNADKEIANITDGLIRQFKVPHGNSDDPSDKLPGGSWTISNPENSGDFTAVGYYFAKEIRKNHSVPIGLLNSSWGGSRIEPWISKSRLDAVNPGYSYETFTTKNNIDRKGQEEKMKKMFPGLNNEDIALKDGKALWVGDEVEGEKWKKVKVDKLWEEQGFQGVDGVAWYRTQFDLDDAQIENEITINLGSIDDSDQTWLNGNLIGKTNGYNVDRSYTVSMDLLRKKSNVLVVRVHDTGGGGGIYANEIKQEIKTSEGIIDLNNLDWAIRFSAIQFAQLNNQIPNLIYNSMIHPITNFPIKGVIWYQGESNAGDVKTAYDYRYLMRTLIQEWRDLWETNDLPFFYVQLANWQQPKMEPSNDGWAVIRESMNDVLQVHNTGQAVIIDIGEADDIHPRNKKDVGYRLALPARNIVYGEDVVRGSPMYLSHKIEGEKVIINFQNLDKGLKVKDKYGYVKGFSIADENQNFEWAQAKIDGNNIIVWSNNIKSPVAVRYAWEINPADANVFSKEGLPLTPFRTDKWKLW